MHLPDRKLSRLSLQMNEDITITIVAGTAVGESATLTPGDTATIGRHKRSDFPVSDLWMSRRHFRIEYDGSNWVLTDLDSSHGTLVNEEEATVRTLNSNDIIFAGNTRFCVTFGNDKPQIDTDANQTSGLGNLLRSLSGVSMQKTMGDS